MSDKEHAHRARLTDVVDSESDRLDMDLRFMVEHYAQLSEGVECLQLAERES